jgi:hypothetical protein
LGCGQNACGNLSKKHEMKVNKQNIRIKHDGFEHQNVGFNLPTKHGGMNQQRHESITIERGEFKNQMNMSFKCPSLSFL